MKLPDVCEKIREGQVWEKRREFKGRRESWTPRGVIPQILITGKAKSRHGNNAWHTTRYDQSTRITHAITEKDIWRFYILIGNRNTIHPLTNEHLKFQPPHL